MKIKALCSFSGVLSMVKDEEKECDNEYVVNDLLRAGYVEAVEKPLPAKASEKEKTTRRKKAVAKSEDK